MVDSVPPAWTTTVMGSPPSGTAEATSDLVSGEYFNQPGNDCPLTVVIVAGVLASVPVVWLGRAKAKPAPEVAISLGTVTAMTPLC